MPYRILKEKIATCRKNHDCYDCGRPIAAKEEALYSVALGREGLLYGHFCYECSRSSWDRLKNRLSLEGRFDGKQRVSRII